MEEGEKEGGREEGLDLSRRMKVHSGRGREGVRGWTEKRMSWKRRKQVGIEVHS